MRPAPAWLAEFQQRFGDAIRTPLDRSTGTLRATPSSFDEALVNMTTDGPAADRTERIAIYNRQYWFRLFTTFHDAYPLTTRLLGAWEMNDYAARFLCARAPSHWDLASATEGFESFLESDLTAKDEPVRRTLVEAARIDRAWQLVFLAPAVPKFRFEEVDAARLLDARLVLSPAVIFVAEHAPLMDLRRRIMNEPGDARVAMPAPFDPPRSRSWALVRRDEGTLLVPLDAQEAQLFELLAKHTVRDALAILEAGSAEGERKLLPEKTRAWLARSVENEFWVGATAQT